MSETEQKNSDETAILKPSLKKVKLIFNPGAGEGLALPPFFQDLFGIKVHRKDWHADKTVYAKKVQNYLKEFDIHPELIFTKCAGDATEIAKECVNNNYDLVIAAGGDGTINEVINGLAGSEVTLGIVPLGTANILAIQLNIPLEAKEACRVIGRGLSIQIDLGKCDGRYFSCMAGIGFDAFVISETKRDFKRKFGALAYVIIAVTRYFRYKFRRIAVRVDDDPKIRVGYFVLVSNGKYYSGKKIIAHKADLTDGLLDVCIFRHKNLMGLFMYLLGIRRHEALKEAKIQYFHCRKVDILKNGRHAVHVDAEFVGHAPVTFEICPGALKVIC